MTATPSGINRWPVLPENSKGITAATETKRVRDSHSRRRSFKVFPCPGERRSWRRKKRAGGAGVWVYWTMTANSVGVLR